MRTRKVFFSLIVALVFATALVAVPAGAAPRLAGGPIERLISSGGSAIFQPRPLGGDAIQVPEFRQGPGDEGGAVTQPRSPTALRTTSGAAAQPLVDRSMSRDGGAGRRFGRGPRPLEIPTVDSADLAGRNPGLLKSFNGLNHRNQRLANGGNQFSIEPPDQALCVGAGSVLEATNDVLRVFDTAGNPKAGVADLNSFYGYAAQINRTTGEQGPFVTDPVCLYDSDVGRFFLVILTLDVFPDTGAFTGKNHLDIAVSQTSDPLGSWTIYRLPVQDDGTDGTPNHQCNPGDGSADATNPNACIGDFPHIGADRYGFYITTNEYDLFGPEFHAAQVYAMSKRQLAAGVTSLRVTQFDTEGDLAGTPGFTVWPAISPPNQASNENGGTEYFLSSMAAEEVQGENGSGLANQIGLWAISHTNTLDSATPQISLANTALRSLTYAVPPQSDQKDGPFPQGQCLNDPACATNILLGVPDPFTEVISHLDSSDSRMMQTWYAKGNLWGALDTAVKVGGELRAGIAYFVVRPGVSGGPGATRVRGEIANQGYLALAHNNVTYPAIATLKDGRGVMAFTLVGQDFYPSAAYAAIDAQEVGAIHVAAAGLGVSDGFTSYKAFVGDPPRTRWGDYGAAAVDGNSIWIASEYIGQSCTLAQYLTAPIGSCGGTRTALANWGTRISQVRP